MTEFKTDFQSFDRDIDRWMKLYGTPGKLSNGTPVTFGLGRAVEFLTNLYFEREAWDALVTRYAETRGWSEVPEFIRLNDALMQSRDARRLKWLWGSIIAEHKSRFWEYHSFCRKARVAGSVEFKFYEVDQAESLLLKDKTELLKTLAHARRIMEGLGETDYAHKLAADYGRIEREERGKKLPKPITRIMDDGCFWELIETARQKSGSQAEQVEYLLESLETFKAAEIRKFGKMLADKMIALYSWDVWALAYLALGGCSDDMFEYFRTWLILQGSDLFEAAMHDVEKLGSRIPRAQARVEGLNLIVETAYENRSGKPWRGRIKGPSKPTGRVWEEADLPARYPALSQYFAPR